VSLCCWTSATLETREEQSLEKGDKEVSDADELRHEPLARFSSKLFEEDIGIGAIIGEDRLRVEEIVSTGASTLTLPNPQECLPSPEEDALRFAIRQARICGGSHG